MDYIFNWFRQIFIIQIISILLGNLVTKEKYLKYVELITSLIMIIMVVNPILYLTGNENILSDTYNSITDYKGIVKSENYGSYSYILKEIEKELESDLYNYLSDKYEIWNIKIELEQNEESNSFGCVRYVYVSVRDVSVREALTDDISNYYGIDRKFIKVNWKG